MFLILIFLTATTVKNHKRLQVLQNKGLRCALGLGIDTSTEELHAEANLLLLKYRREQHVINFMYDFAYSNSHCLKAPTKGHPVSKEEAS